MSSSESESWSDMRVVVGGWAFGWFDAEFVVELLVVAGVSGSVFWAESVDEVLPCLSLLVLDTTSTLGGAKGGTRGGRDGLVGLIAATTAAALLRSSAIVARRFATF